MKNTENEELELQEAVAGIRKEDETEFLELSEKEEKALLKRLVEKAHLRALGESK